MSNTGAHFSGKRHTGLKQRYGTFPIGRCAIAIAAMVTACNDELPPVENTAPSEDPRILEAPRTMSDGTPIEPHHTETIHTSIEMVSVGAIGGVSVDAAGNMYNTNFKTDVWKTAPDGATVLLSGEFSAASGNFVLPDGGLLQADYTENAIFRIEPDGSRSIFSDEGLDGPVGIVQKHDGDFVVANHRGGFLASVPETGGAATVVLRDDRMTGPNGVTIDPAGNIYVADLRTAIVFKWTAEGDLLELAVLPGKGNAHNVYAGGALYVNKIWDHVIYRVDLETGAYGIVTGSGRPGYDDGPTGVATIEEPNGIATNTAKNIVYFNTHRGTMGDGRGLVIPRRLLLPS